MPNIAVETLNALYKERFADGVIKNDYLAYLVNKLPREMASDKLSIAINLKRSSSLSYASNPDMIYSYDDYNPPVMRKIEVQPCFKYFKVVIPQGVVDGLSVSAGGDRLARKDASYFMDESREVNAMRMEASILYGEQIFPKIQTTLSTTWGSKTSINTATPPQIAVSVKSTEKPSDAIFRLLDGAKVNFVTKNTANTDEAIVSSGVNSIFRVDTIDTSGTTAKILLTGTSTGISALQTAVAAAGAEIRIVAHGQFGNDCNSLAELCSSTGEVLGIDDTEFPEWKGNSISVSGDLSIDTIKKGVSLILSRTNAMKPQTFTLLISGKSWDTLAAEIEANRQFDSSYSLEKNFVGQKEIGIFHRNSFIKIMYHYLVKESDAFLLSDFKDNRGLGLVTRTFKKSDGGDLGLLVRYPNGKGFHMSEKETSAYMTGHCYLNLFTRDRRREAMFTGIS